MSDRQAFEIQLTENIQRKTMDPIEEAEAFRKYVIDFGWGGVCDLAKRIGKSEEYVSHRIQLLKLPDEIKKKISDNMINVSKAIEISSIPVDSHPQILEEIIRNKISVKKLREMKRAIKENIDEQNTNLSNRNNSYFFKSLKIAKKASLSLRVSLARIDNLIEEVEVTIEPENRTEIINFLMEIRLKIHELIDETIRFKNYSRKTIKI
jgi:ParB family chromosome partitioning protein